MRKLLKTEGYSILMDDDKWNGFVLSVNGFRYELHIRDWIYREVPGRVFINVGANYGIHVLNAYRAGAKKILAFEPLEEVYSYLVENVAVNNMTDRVTCHNLAIGDFQGTVYMKKGTSDNGVVNWSDPLDGEIPVKASTLMPFLEDMYSEEVVFLIDAEGSEFKVFKGMQEYIRRRKPRMVFEILLDHFFPEEIEENLKWLSSLGYRFRIFDRPNQRGVCSSDVSIIFSRIKESKDGVLDVDAIPSPPNLFKVL